jgi:GNAT superfamily N-acetyltransferase
MYTISTESEYPEMLAHLNEAATWIQTPAEFKNWTDRDFEFGQPIAKFLDYGIPKEVLALKQGEQMLAYAELHQNSFGWVIARVLVHPQRRNQGLARKIMKACIDRVFEQNFVVSLFCVLDNTPARTLYESLGFSGLEMYPDQNMQRMSLINPVLGSNSEEEVQSESTSNGLVS